MTNIDRINSYRLYRTAGGLLLAGILTLAAIACSPPAAPDKTAASTATKAARARVAAANTDRGRATARLAAAGSNSPAPAVSAAAGPGSVTRYAADAPGADWGAKLQYAIDGCPPGAICEINAKDLIGGTAAADVVFSTPEVRIALGAGTYAFAAHHGFKFMPHGGGKGPTQLITGFELSGEGKDLTTLACTNGNRAAERCLEIEGTGFANRSGSPFPLVGGGIGGSIAAGDTSFTAAAADIAATGVGPGDWLMVGHFKVSPNNRTFDFNGLEQKQVLWVSGATIAVSAPFERSYGGSAAAAVWTKYTALLWNPSIHDLTIDNSASAGVALRTLSTNGLRVTDSRLIMGNIATGETEVGYSAGVQFERDEFVSTASGVFPVELASCNGCAIRNSTFRCSAPDISSTGPIFDFGTSYSYFEGNVLGCSGSGKSGFGVTDADHNYVRGNIVTGIAEGNSVGISLSGASGTLVGGNNVSDFVNAFAVHRTVESLQTPAWASNAVYPPNTCVLAAPDNGYIFCTATGGTSGASQPSWVMQGSSAYGLAGTTTADNTVLWTCGGRYQRADYNTFVSNQAFHVSNGIVYGADTVGNMGLASQPWTSTGGLLSVD